MISRTPLPRTARLPAPAIRALSRKHWPGAVAGYGGASAEHVERRLRYMTAQASSTAECPRTLSVRAPRAFRIIAYSARILRKLCGYSMQKIRRRAVAAWLAQAALLWAVVAAWPARGQSPPEFSAPRAQPQIDGSIDDRALTRLPGNVHFLAQARYDRGPAADSLPLSHILLLIKRGPQQQRALDELMLEQYEPSSANYHHWLTPEQYGSMFGPAAEDVQQIEGWLTQKGFTVNRVAAGRTFIDFSGTAGQIAAAFHTRIHFYEVDGERHYANASDPWIPAALAPLVSGFRALNDFHPRPLSLTPGVVRRDRATGKWLRVTSDGHLTDGAGASASYLVGPQDFAQIYGLNPVWAETAATPSGAQKLTGAGETIGVVGDTDLAAADIASFRNQFGLTAIGPNGSVQVNHPPANVCQAPNPSDNDPEGYIDAEWAGATAPDATIDFVTCSNSGVTSGADLAAAYIVQDAAQSQAVGVLSSSYGYCEQNPISESDQFYVALWQQAAAEGITVVVAAGDAGPAECDEFTGVPYATHGFAVNAEASTPYNIAVGGTDFSDVFSGDAANYWSASNGPDLESALSYIPEMTWNDSCASPLVLEAFGSGSSSSAGSSGFCTYASRLPVDPSTAFSPYFNHFAGSGGLSAVSARPPWQTGVTGLPGGGARALPDLSLFASDGLTWGHALLFCDSGFLPSGITCDLSNSANIYDNENGGTSFAAPAFAGIIALIEQKSGSRQGQADNVLYSLAAEQYVSGGGAKQPSLANCAAYLGTGALASCYFHDISGTPSPGASSSAPLVAGNISVPCTGSATAAGVYTDASSGAASNSENCYGYQITVSGSGSGLSTTPDYYGVLSTSDSADSQAYSAGPGYDLATGLGSPNVAALVNAPQWSPLAVTTSSLPNGVAGVAYSQTLQASGGVPPYTWSIVSSSLPPGLTLAADSGMVSGTPTAAGTSEFTVQVEDSEGEPATATASLTLTVNGAPAASSTMLTSSSPTAGVGMNVTFTATVSGSGPTPTGTITFYNGGTILGASTLVNGAASLTKAFSAAGAVTVEAKYSGDANYSPSASAPFTETVVTPGFTVAANPTSLTLPFAGSGAVALTVTSQGGFAGPIRFACGTLPEYFSCGFAKPSLALTASGAISNTVTIYAALATNAAAAPGGGGSAGGRILLAAFWAPLAAGLIFRRRRRPFTPIGMAVLLGIGLAAAGAAVGCGQPDHQAPAAVYNIPITVSSPGAVSQTVTVTVNVGLP